MKDWKVKKRVFELDWRSYYISVISLGLYHIISYHIIRSLSLTTLAVSLTVQELKSLLDELQTLTDFMAEYVQVNGSFRHVHSRHEANLAGRKERAA